MSKAAARKPVFIRTQFNYDTVSASRDSGLACQEPTRTQQHFRDECDINTILKNFSVTGVLPSQPLSPRYGDFSNIGDYHACLNAVRAAEGEFNALPATLRERFGYDPANLIAFMADERNRDEAIKLGLVASPRRFEEQLDLLDGGSENEPPAKPKAPVAP